MPTHVPPPPPVSSLPLTSPPLFAAPLSTLASLLLSCFLPFYVWRVRGGCVSGTHAPCWGRTPARVETCVACTLRARARAALRTMCPRGAQKPARCHGRKRTSCCRTPTASSGSTPRARRHRPRRCAAPPRPCPPPTVRRVTRARCRPRRCHHAPPPRWTRRWARRHGHPRPATSAPPGGGPPARRRLHPLRRGDPVPAPAPPPLTPAPAPTPPPTAARQTRARARWRQQRQQRRRRRGGRQWPPRRRTTCRLWGAQWACVGPAA
jgi:hypothetical protein